MARRRLKMTKAAIAARRRYRQKVRRRKRRGGDFLGDVGNFFKSGLFRGAR